MTTARIAAPARPPPRRAGQQDYLSFSAIRTYQECPLKYFFRYIAGLPEESVSASLVFGGAIHRAIEHHYRELLAGNPPPELPIVVEAYQEGWSERDPKFVRLGKGDTCESLDALAHRMLGAFRENSLARPEGTILAVEEELRGAVIPGLPDLLGRVDLIVETTEALVVSDWKTSRSKWHADQVEESAEQLLLYTELAHDFAPGKQLRIEFTVDQGSGHRAAWPDGPTSARGSHKARDRTSLERDRGSALLPGPLAHRMSWLPVSWPLPEVVRIVPFAELLQDDTMQLDVLAIPPVEAE